MPREESSVDKGDPAVTDASTGASEKPAPSPEEDPVPSPETDAPPSDEDPPSEEAVSTPVEDEEREEKALVITSTRVPQPKRSVSAPVEVLSKKEIEESGARTAADLLERRSFVDIKTYGPAGGLQLPSLRGVGVEQVLVMIDGRRVNPPQGGGADLSDLDLQGIRRVEVLRGPASALYGSDAMGGVIQLITDLPDGPPRTRFVEELGSFGYRSSRFSRSETLGRVGYILSARQVQSSGDFSYTDPIRGSTVRRANSAYDSDSLRLTIIPDFRGNDRLTASFDWNQSERGTPGPIESPSSATQTDRLASLQLHFRSDAGDSPPAGKRRIAYEWKAYRQGQRRLFDALKDRPIAYRTHQRVDATGLEGLARGVLGSIPLTAGWEWRGEKVTTTRLDPKNRSVLGLYLLGEARAGKWTAIPALRWDRITNAGSRVSPQLGLLRPLSGKWTARANVGKGFRAPSINDLYWPEDPFTLGNANLKSEVSTSADLGVSYSEGAWSFEMTAFHSRIDDLVVWTPGALKPGKWSPVNVGEASLRGFEWTGGYRAGAWSVHFTGTTLDARDNTPGVVTSNRQLIYRPAATARINAGWLGAPWSAGLDLLYTGRRFASPDNTVRFGGHAVVNARVARAVGPWDAELMIDNLFHRRYQIQAGYPLPGREARFALRRRW